MKEDHLQAKSYRRASSVLVKTNHSAQEASKGCEQTRQQQ